MRSSTKPYRRITTSPVDDISFVAPATNERKRHGMSKVDSTPEIKSFWNGLPRDPPEFRHWSLNPFGEQGRAKFRGSPYTAHATVSWSGREQQGKPVQCRVFSASATSSASGCASGATMHENDRTDLRQRRRPIGFSAPRALIVVIVWALPVMLLGFIPVTCGSVSWGDFCSVTRGV